MHLFRPEQLPATHDGKMYGWIIEWELSGLRIHHLSAPFSAYLNPAVDDMVGSHMVYRYSTVGILTS